MQLSTLIDLGYAVARLGLVGIARNVAWRFLKRREVPVEQGLLTRALEAPEIAFLQDKSVHTLGVDGFDFFGADYRLDGRPWHLIGSDPLGTYHLQYMDVLSAPSQSAQTSLLELIDRWIEENTIVSAWEPYTTSRRLINWVKFFARNPSLLTAKVTTSLLHQYASLNHTLETHLMANHYFANLKALLFVEACFADGAEERLNATLARISQQIDEQVLSDFGHFELCVTYHVNFLDDLLDICTLIENTPRLQQMPAAQALLSNIRDLIPGMYRWATDLCHDDIPAQFSDTSRELMTPLATISEKMQSLGIAVSVEPAPAGLTVHEASGYMHFTAARYKAIVDCGDFGAQVNPGHGHADIGALEVSVGNRLLICNGGTGSYHDATLRQRARSTANYSTYLSPLGNSSRVFGKFRVGKAAKLLSRAWENHEGHSMFELSYRGFPKPFSAYRHSRKLEFHDSEIRICDRVHAKSEGKIQYFLAFETYERLGPSEIILNGSDDFPFQVSVKADKPLSVMPSECFEDINIKRACLKLEIPHSGSPDDTISLTVKLHEKS